MLSKRSHSAPGCCRTKPLLKPLTQKQNPTHLAATKSPSIARTVESLVLEIISAINTRHFTPHTTNPTIDPEFIGSIRYPWGGRAPTSWPDTLATFSALVAQYPHYRIARPLMYTEVYGDAYVYAGVGRPRTKRGEEGRYADVFVNFDVEGMGEGVVRQSVGIWRFRRGEGADGEGDGDGWRCFSMQCLDGCGRCDGLGGVECFVGMV